MIYTVEKEKLMAHPKAKAFVKYVYSVCPYAEENDIFNVTDNYGFIMCDKENPYYMFDATKKEKYFDGGLLSVDKFLDVAFPKQEKDKTVKRRKGVKNTPKSVNKIHILYAPDFSKNESDVTKYVVKNPIAFDLTEDTICISVMKEKLSDTISKVETIIIPRSEVCALRVSGPRQNFVLDLFTPDGKMIMVQNGADFVVEKINVLFT